MNPEQIEALERLASLAGNKNYNGQAEQEKEIRRPRFDGTINLGHILTILTMGAALATVWVNGRIAQSDHESRIKTLESSRIEMNSTIAKVVETANQGMINQEKISIALQYLTRDAKQKPNP